MQDADRVDEIKTLERKRRVVQIGLHDVNVSGFGVSMSHFYCRPEIDRPDFRAILGSVVSEASIAATSVEDFLSGKEVGGVRLHVVEKLFFPFLVHLGKAVPLVTKTQRRFGLPLVVSRRLPLAGQSITHVREQQPRYVVDDWV